MKTINIVELYKNLPTGYFDINWEMIYDGDKVIDEYGYKYKVFYSTEYACWFLKDIKDGTEKPIALDSPKEYASEKLKIYSKNKKAREKYKLKRNSK